VDWTRAVSQPVCTHGWTTQPDGW